MLELLFTILEELVILRCWGRSLYASPDKQESLKDYKKLIQKYQDKSKIKLFVSTDFEGAWSPFTKANVSEKNFPKFSDIKNSQEAYFIGKEQGKLLKELGFNIDFSPVAEFKDLAYGGAGFFRLKRRN